VGPSTYDEIADWYEKEFLGDRLDNGLPAADPIGIDKALSDLLRRGQGRCLEIGCGTGIHAARIRQLGWTPIGVDVSAGMLRYASGRLAISLADGAKLPFPSRVFPRVVAVMIHTDVADYAAIVNEAARVLEPGGVFVHVGVHPCFCGGFADRSDPEAIVIHDGYLHRYWTKESWTDRGVRDKVGATHLPLTELLRLFVDAGLRIEKSLEGGKPTPAVLAIEARKS